MALPQQLAIAESRLHREQTGARVVEKEVLRRRKCKQETSQFKHAESLRMLKSWRTGIYGSIWDS